MYNYNMTDPNFDYRKYVSFEPSREMIKDGVNPNAVQLTPDERSRLERAFKEIASTPEGQKLIQRAAASGPDGKINVVCNTGGITAARRPNDILLGTADAGFQYYSPETHSFHDIPIQDLLVHEMNHMAHGHKGNDASGQNRHEEAEAIRETNKFMKKYYNRPARDEDPTKGRIGGTPQWDVDENFNPKGYPQRRSNAEPKIDEFLKKGDIHVAGVDLSGKFKEKAEGVAVAEQQPSAPAVRPAPGNNAHTI